MERRDPWIRRARPEPHAKLRLFCLPPAGGGTAVFAGWATEVPRGVEVVAVCPPGREARLGEEAIREPRALVAAAAAALRPYLDRPYALLGHSMGAWLGFEMARRWRETGHPEPVHFYPCAHRAPHLPYPSPAISEWPKEAFLAELRRRNGTPPGVLASQELMDLLLPLLRADFAACERYAFQPAAPLSGPITAYGGTADPDVSRTDLESWGSHTAGRFEARWIDGDHFFPQQQRALFLADLGGELRRDLEAVA